jgi:hypothetical protein
MATISESKRKVKEFPPELDWVTDQDKKGFDLAMEGDTNKKSKHFVGLDQLFALACPRSKEARQTQANADDDRQTSGRRRRRKAESVQGYAILRA